MQGTAPQNLGRNALQRKVRGDSKEGYTTHRITVNVKAGYTCMNRLVTLSASWNTRLFLHVITALATEPWLRQ
jgi:hypothetical protein